MPEMERELRGTRWEPESRKFTGRIYWGEWSPIYDDRHWQLTIIFNEDFTAIESGELICQGEDSERQKYLTHIYKFNVDLKFVQTTNGQVV